MNLRLVLASLVLVLLALAPHLAGAEPVNASVLGGVAVEGHDVVAYHLVGKAVEGSRDFVHEWRGATWRFANAANRDLFAKEPERYAPRYGGFCAYGMSRGYAVGIDPRAFSLVDGRLYLNYSLDVQREWAKDAKALIEKADANWAKHVAREK